MCLVTSMENFKVLIAEEDIIGYKLIKRRNIIDRILRSVRSPIFAFRYKLNTLYKCEMNIMDFPSAGEVRVEEGFHMYVDKCYAASWVVAGKPYKRIRTCVIPKGASYIVSWNKREMVSNQIIIKRK